MAGGRCEPKEGRAGSRIGSRRQREGSHSQCLVGLGAGSEFSFMPNERPLKGAKQKYNVTGFLSLKITMTLGHKVDFQRPGHDRNRMTFAAAAAGKDEGGSRDGDARCILRHILEAEMTEMAD